MGDPVCRDRIGIRVLPLSRGAIGIPLYLAILGALTGLPLRWGTFELIDELTPNHRDR